TASSVPRRVRERIRSPWDDRMEARETTEWTDFHRAALQRPPRELLRRTLGCLELEGFPPDVAVDLGCGSGADSLEMLKRGWTVHAVDADAGGTAMLRDAVPEGL